VLDLVLRFPRPERLRQIVPEFEQPPVQHLQDATDIARAVAIEIQRRELRVRIVRRISIAFAIQELHRHQRIEEIADPALMHADLLRQLHARQFPILQDREHAQLDRAQQNFRGPKSESSL
jgi:hypothetical protein